MIPVPMISPATAAQMRPRDAWYSTPESAAPKTAPVSASGGMPISVMRMTPMSAAQRKACRGPRKTAHTILMRCAMGHMPSMRRIGDMTTPSPTIMAKKTNRRICFSFFKFFTPSGKLRPAGVRKASDAGDCAARPVGRHSVVPSHPETRVPSHSKTTQGAPPRSISVYHEAESRKKRRYAMRTFFLFYIDSFSLTRERMPAICFVRRKKLSTSAHSSTV